MFHREYILRGCTCLASSYTDVREQQTALHTAVVYICLDNVPTHILSHDVSLAALCRYYILPLVLVLVLLLWVSRCRSGMDLPLHRARRRTTLRPQVFLFLSGWQ